MVESLWWEMLGGGEHISTGEEIFTQRGADFSRVPVPWDSVRALHMAIFWVVGVVCLGFYFSRQTCGESRIPFVVDGSCPRASCSDAVLH